MSAYSPPGFIIYRGRPSLEARSIGVKGDSGNKDVITLLKGRAGHTPGPFMATLDVKSAVPSTGPEVDWFLVCASGEEVELGFKIAGNTYNFRGDVRDVSWSTESEGSPNGIDFTFHGTFVGTA